MSNGGWAVVIAALVAAVVAPWVKARIERQRRNEDDASTERKVGAALAVQQIDQLFKETDRLRSTYRADIDDLRAQLQDARGRVANLEQEVAEWRAGLHGVPGVWVAVPASVWEFVRSSLPDLPETRFPGERGALPSADEPG